MGRDDVVGSISCAAGDIKDAQVQSHAIYPWKRVDRHHSLQGFFLMIQSTSTLEVQITNHHRVITEPSRSLENVVAIDSKDRDKIAGYASIYKF